MRCRKEDYCQFGSVVDDDGETDITDKDPKRCTRCIMTGYSLFEPVEDDEDD